MGSFDVTLDEERTQLEAFIEEYRNMIELTLDRLTEEQARRRLVPSATTLLGLLKHVTWMQRVWFEECVGGTSRRELGLVQTPDESFRLGDDDTIASVTAAHRQACATARAAVAELPLDAVVTGHRAGPRTVRWVYFQVLRRAGSPLRTCRHPARTDTCRLRILGALSPQKPSRPLRPGPQPFTPARRLDVGLPGRAHRVDLQSCGGIGHRQMVDPRGVVDGRHAGDAIMIGHREHHP